MDLKGKIAVVTGGGRGIGRAISLGLARAGADISLCYARGKDAAEETKTQIEKLGRRAEAIQCDVANEGEVKSYIAQTIAKLGGIDILVCNAGIASRGNMIRDTTTEEMRRVLDTHVMGSFWCCREAMDSLRASGEGRIILLSSIATISNGARGGPYCMAKSAMESLMKVLTREEGPNGIRVNVIGPGLVETEMGKRLVKARDKVDIKDLYTRFPFGRVGQPEDIANLAVFLSSKDAEYISGQVVYVHGGGFQKFNVA